MSLTAEELAAIVSNPAPSIIPPKLWEEPWEFGCGIDDFKLPPPYPDLDGRDFPWAPKVPQMMLRSGKKCVQLYTGSYQASTEESSYGWVDTRVRLRGTQRYTNGDKFDGDFTNYNGTPSKGTYTFANGDTLEGHFTGVSYGEIHPNTISMGTFHNKDLGISYTGQWVRHHLVETSLMGYILVEFNPLSEASRCQVFYYRHNKYYENFNAWFIDQTDGYGDPGYAPTPFLLDDTLHPDSSEGQWLAEFKTKVNDLVNNPPRRCQGCGDLEDLSHGGRRNAFSSCVPSMCEACVEDCVLGYRDYPSSSTPVPWTCLPDVTASKEPRRCQECGVPEDLFPKGFKRSDVAMCEACVGWSGWGNA